MKQQVVMATTHLDRHFQRFAKSALEQMAEEIVSGEARPIVNIEHDPTLPPIGKVLEAKVVLREDGEYELVAVHEIFEKIFWTELEDGRWLFRQESDTDQHPFIDKYAGLPTGYGVSYDPISFVDKRSIELFIDDVQTQSQVEFSTGLMGRKSQLTDPEFIVRLADVVALYLFAGFAKKAGDKIVDKLADLAAEEVARFYSFIRSVVVSAIKYSGPKGRPITYVFVAVGNPTIEFIVRSTDADTVLNAIALDKFESALTNASRFQTVLEAVRIQYLLSENGEWEFNYMLTNSGAVIGTEKIFAKRTRVFQLLSDRIRENDQSVSSDG